MKALIFSSTPRSNLGLSEEFKKIATELGLETKIIVLEDENLPLYSPQEEERNGVPPRAKTLSDEIAAADVFGVVAPEYNGLIPPNVNNTIAWISRSGPDWRGSFNKKVTFIASQSGGGGFSCLKALRQQLEYLGALVLPRTVMVNGGKPFNPDSAKDILEFAKQIASR